jgi:hypothetical protein
LVGHLDAALQLAGAPEVDVSGGGGGHGVVSGR